MNMHGYLTNCSCPICADLARSDMWSKTAPDTSAVTMTIGENPAAKPKMCRTDTKHVRPCGPTPDDMYCACGCSGDDVWCEAEDPAADRIVSTEFIDQCFKEHGYSWNKTRPDLLQSIRNSHAALLEKNPQLDPAQHQILPNGQVELSPGLWVDRKKTPDNSIEERLKEIEARHKNAVLGTWVSCSDGPHSPAWVETEQNNESFAQVFTGALNRLVTKLWPIPGQSLEQHEKNAEFIAAAHQDVPWLVQELRKALAERDALRKQLEAKK